MRYVWFCIVAAGIGCSGGDGDFKCTPICSPGPGGGQDKGGLTTYSITADNSTDAGSDCVVMAETDGSAACPVSYTPVSCTCTE